eukprot:5321010-Amphidinium_carterae.2
MQGDCERWACGEHMMRTRCCLGSGGMVHYLPLHSGDYPSDCRTWPGLFQGCSLALTRCK